VSCDLTDTKREVSRSTFTVKTTLAALCMCIPMICDMLPLARLGVRARLLAHVVPVGVGVGVAPLVFGFVCVGRCLVWSTPLLLSHRVGVCVLDYA